MTEPSITLPTVREALASMEELIGACVSSVSREDPGLFGPQSVSWRIFREPAYSASAIAALLMMALHPVAMAAVDQHSDYRRDAWRRAHRTTQYVFTITFSSTAVAQQAAERVRSVHRRIVGTDPITGRSYRADDPELLLWIHCVNTQMALAGQQALARKLSARDQDRFVREQVRAAALVGLAPEAVPATSGALSAYLAGVDELLLTPPAREFADLLLKARMPWTMRPFWALHVVAAIALLPQQIRSIYRFPRWLPRGPIALAGIRLTLRMMDLSYAALPSIRRARRHLRAIQRPARA